MPPAPPPLRRLARRSRRLFEYIWYCGPWVHLSDEDRARQDMVRRNHAEMDGVTSRKIGEFGELMQRVLERALGTLETLALVTSLQNPAGGVDEEDDGEDSDGMHEISQADPRVAALLHFDAYPSLTHFTLRNNELGRAADIFQVSGSSIRFPALTHLHVVTAHSLLPTLRTISRRALGTPNLTHLRLTGGLARYFLPRELSSPVTASADLPSTIIIEPDFSPSLPSLGEDEIDIGCGTGYFEYMDLFNADSFAVSGAGSRVYVVPPREDEHRLGRQYELARAVDEFLAYIKHTDGASGWEEPVQAASGNFWCVILVNSSAPEGLPPACVCRWERDMKSQTWRDTTEL
ncbi:hypothetical protein C8F01DRAFT_1253730 [Mycena amicta]|nr:hypothetical protein C8F01DRAFT_1253730 [Mycena amicta]